MTATATATAEAVAALSAHGVYVAGRLVAERGPALCLAWCRYADYTGIDPGAIVYGVRSGQLPPSPKRLDVQWIHGKRISEWLNENYEHGAHPAAVIELIRLHYVLGRGTSLDEFLATARPDIDGSISAAVAAWNNQETEAA